MAGETSHYGLQKLGQGDPFSTNGYQFTNADRDYIDRLLWLGAEGHVHTGGSGSASGPTQPPELTLSTTGGTIPAGVRVYYKYTLVDANGNETAGSPEGFVDTPAAITEPAAPTLTTTPTGGTLQPGNYYYVLSAYTTAYTQETFARNPTYITVPVGTTTNQVTVVMPTPPAGADGFNIYRKRPGASGYLYLTSVPIATTSYVDDGTTPEDCNRIPPVRNTTNATNAVQVCLAGVTPTVPPGYTWKVYRTYVSASYDNTLLHWVTEESSPGVITPCTEDVGNGTSLGRPPTSDQGSASPSKIDLQDAANVEGQLPLGLTSHPMTITFAYSGPLTATAQGTNAWVCEAPGATILACRASLGRGSTPASSNVIVDVNKGTGLTPTYTTIYTTQANRPKVLVGNQIGTKSYPDIKTLVEGDSLTVDIDQVGGGATPTDANLTVNIYLVLHGYPQGASYVPGTTTGSGA